MGRQGNGQLARSVLAQGNGNKGKRMSTLAFEEVLVSSKGVSTGNLKTAMFLHGLLGSARNWRTFSKYLTQVLADSNSAGWRLLFVDLRNHGQSAKLSGFGPPHDIASAARDLSQLVKTQGWGWPEIVSGHSLGGKVVLDFADKAVSGSYGREAVPPRQIWVLDSVPGKMPLDDGGGEVERVLATLNSIPTPIPSRRWLQDHMTKLGFSPGLSAWLGSNLKASDDPAEMEWTFNLQEARDMFLSYRKQDYWSLLENPPKGMQIGVVRAIRSDRWTPGIVDRLEKVAAQNHKHTEQAGVVSYHVLENAGHWLHSDNPRGLAEILAPSFTKMS